MTARVIPFPSPAPFDVQERIFGVILDDLVACLPALPDIDRQILARRLALKVTLQASIAIERRVRFDDLPTTSPL